MRDALPRLNGAFDGSDDKQIDRRHLLKMGAWAAPVIVLATAAPAAAAVSGPPPQPAPLNSGLPLAKLDVSTFGVWNNSGSGALGPLKGNLRVEFNNSDNSYNPPAQATVAYLIEVRRPGTTTWQTATSSSVVMATTKWYAGTATDWAWGTANMAPGTYQFRVTVTGSDGAGMKKLITLKL